MKPNLLITNDHRDITGGGTYVMMFLHVLQKYFNIYTDRDIEYYSDHNTPWNLEKGKVKAIPDNFVPDLHIYASYGGWIEPKSKNNFQIIYFPKHKKIDNWSNFFVLNDFCKNACKDLWGKDSHIVNPFFDFSKYYISEKSNCIINIGQYFYESDGHSKNQHLIIDWFKKQNVADRLILHGMINNHDYYNHLLKLAEDDKRIIIKANQPQEIIRQDLSESKYMIHAIGYGRTNQAQTEHFGLVAIEALLSGCQPIVHNSGGCKDILGVKTYNSFDDIVLEETNIEKLIELGQVYSIENTELQLKRAINV